MLATAAAPLTPAGAQTGGVLSASAAADRLPYCTVVLPPAGCVAPSPRGGEGGGRDVVDGAMAEETEGVTRSIGSIPTATSTTSRGCPPASSPTSATAGDVTAPLSAGDVITVFFTREMIAALAPQMKQLQQQHAQQHSFLGAGAGVSSPPP